MTRRNLFLALFALAACSDRPASSDTARDSATPAAPGAPAATSDTTRTAPRADSSAAGNVLTERGIGPLRIGMTVSQARAAMPGFTATGNGCTYATKVGLPVHVMVENGVVARIDVDSGTVATAEGARIGDTVARVKSLYGARLTTQPNKYTSDPDLIVRSASDTSYQYIFETKADRVIRYRAGKLPQVAYVERCG